MRSLNDVISFGGTDADNDDILLRAFEDHEAFTDVLSLKKHMIIGKKGSGKTAIFKKLITTREPQYFAFGHTFSDYPWHHHDLQARIGIPDFDKYTHSWKFLILMSVAKIALNSDESLPWDASHLDDMVKIESFVVDTYGSRDPDITQIFNPIKKLKLKPYFAIDFKLLKAGISPEAVPVSDLPTIIQEVNCAFLTNILRCLNPKHKYFIAFDQLDIGFDVNSKEYINRLIGLLLACRDINIAAKESNIKLFVVIFLRDDIYDCLHFEDKNKMTENYVSTIEWDTQRTQKTLRSLMEKRFNIVLGSENEDKNIQWQDVFNEERKMPSKQSKYEHMLDRTYRRPRDMIKFANCALAQHQERTKIMETTEDHKTKIDNIDIHNARQDYSDYFFRELDDEIHKHLPNYDSLLNVLRIIGKWHFDKDEFIAAYPDQPPMASTSPTEAIEALFNNSIIGFYRAGGRGFGGSEYAFKYREQRIKFDHTTTRFRIHPGLIESLNLKKA